MASVTFNSSGQIISSLDAGLCCDESMTICPGHANELNFGGTSDSSTIYFGYRAWGSRPRPTAFHFGVNDASVSAGSYNASSTREVKHDIKEFNDSALDKIDDIDVVYYVYNNDETEKKRVGFIAEDTDELFAFKTHDGMDINTCIGVLMKAVQELIAKKNKLELEIEELKNKTSG